MNRQEIKLIVEKQIHKAIGDANITIKEESNLETDIGFDSLDNVEFTMFLEDEFDIEIPDEDAFKCKTVANVIDYLVSQGC